MPRLSPYTRSRNKRRADKRPTPRRSLSLSPSSAPSHPSSATMPRSSASVSIADLESAITSCLSNDSFVNKIITVLATKVKDAVVEALTESLREARDEIKALKSEVSSLKSGLQRVENQWAARQDELEQYSRRNNLRVYGVPEVPGEDTDIAVSKILKEKLKLDIPLERIDRSHRVGKSQGPAADGSARWRPIIVRFSSYRDRRSVYSSKKLLKGTGVLIREDLTGRRAEVLRAAIAKHGVRNTWTADGTIHWVLDGVKGAAKTMSDLQ